MSKPIKRAGRPAVEVLETRQLLSSVFAQLEGGPVPAKGHETITLKVARGEFHLPRGRVLLGFTVAESGGTSGKMLMLQGGHVLLRRANPAAGATKLMLASVGSGSVDLQMIAGKAAMGPMTIDVYLAGDANGDQKVNAQDLHQIRSLLGVRQGQPGYSLDADVNRDGVINARDWQLARLNLGVSTRVRPLSATVALSPVSDPDGNGVVITPTVVLTGQTVPGATVRLVSPVSVEANPIVPTTKADAQGNYQLSINIPTTGTIPIEVEATDRFGQTATAGMTIVRGDVVIAWDRALIDAIRADQLSVGPASRAMAMVMGSVYDAVNDIDHAHAVYLTNATVPATTSAVASASTAAYDVLVALFPDQKAHFDATLAESLATVPNGPARSDGMALGQQVAAAMLAWRVNDGSNADPVYKVGTAPGQWQPTPPDYTIAWGPAWGQVKPFGVPSASDFQPPPPPALNSPEYTAAYNQVMSLGAVNSTTRTADQTQIADFWAYDASVFGPPVVHYNQVTETLALQQHNSLDQDARLFALVDISMADAGISAWDAKYTYAFWRPVTAIQQGNSDGNPNTAGDPSWMPLGAPGDGIRANFSPAFPAYISGHATFGGAMFQTLTDFYGTDNLSFTLTSDELPGVTRNYTSFSQAAQENAQSRIYLGIHWQFDATNGIAVGDAIGNYVSQHLLQ
ncbi:MAG: dockerin type I domain-containing protein [Isosphaerales bacterium]